MDYHSKEGQAMIERLDEIKAICREALRQDDLTPEEKRVWLERQAVAIYAIGDLI